MGTTTPRCHTLAAVEACRMMSPSFLNDAAANQASCVQQNVPTRRYTRLVGDWREVLAKVAALTCSSNLLFGENQDWMIHRTQLNVRVVLTCGTMCTVEASALLSP